MTPFLKQKCSLPLYQFYSLKSRMPLIRPIIYTQKSPEQHPLYLSFEIQAVYGSSDIHVQSDSGNQWRPKA